MPTFSWGDRQMQGIFGMSFHSQAQGLKILNQIVPGVNADSTLIYAPKIKFYSIEINVIDSSLQTPL
jgi:uncharacterized FAD-dependent dehydrogenase